MTRMRLIGAAMHAIALFPGQSSTAAAQNNASQYTVTNADVQRLQDTVYDASRDVAQVRSRDAALASQLQAELDDARDEVIYLKV